MSQTYNPKDTKAIRKKLRNNPTGPEVILWQKLKNRQFFGLKFRRQHGILEYIVDFYCHEHKLAIELDGDTHYASESHLEDQQRQKEIEALGIRVFRYSNKEITQNMHGVLTDVAIKLNLQPPPPLLKKEGKEALPLNKGELEGVETNYTIQSNQDKSIPITKSGIYTVKLVGEGAHVDITGLFKLTGTDRLDIDLTIIHAAPHTSADTNLRAVVDDSAVASINGTIIVQKNAQQTNSFLNENILLLSKTAQAHAIPNLEIEADDVKCSHAATVATIDDEHLFYLQSRGIPETQAKAMIADGFLKL